MRARYIVTCVNGVVWVAIPESQRVVSAPVSIGVALLGVTITVGHAGRVLWRVVLSVGSVLGWNVVARTTTAMTMR